MSHNRTAHINLLDVMQTPDRLENLLATIDDLHSAASEGEMTGFTTLNNREVINLLREVIYTAQETIDELETREQSQPVLRIVEKIGKAG